MKVFETENGQFALDSFFKTYEYVDSKNCERTMYIRDSMHAAKLLHLLKLKEREVALQLDIVRSYMKDFT